MNPPAELTPDRARTSRRLRLPRLSVIRVSMVLALALIVASWVYVLGVDRIQTHSFISAETLGRFTGFMRDLLGLNSTRTPAFAQWDQWVRVGGLAYQTLIMSVLGIGFAGLVALATFMFGASNVMMGDLAPYGSWLWRGIFLVVRATFVFLRAIPELVWALLIVFIFSPGILPGALALGLHNAGILGKLASEIVEGLDPRPMQALRASGANRLQVLAYGVLPQALPRFTTYLFYRWEVIIRTTIVVGFVAAGGLGLEFRLAMSHFHYTTVTLLLMWYLLLVIGVDLLSAWLRKLSV
jgi:phosphonate transport system permease protein